MPFTRACLHKLFGILPRRSQYNCVCICAMCVCIHEYGGQRLMVGVFWVTLHHIFRDQDSHWTWCSPNQQGRLTNEPKGYPASTFFPNWTLQHLLPVFWALRLQMYASSPRIQASELRSSCFHTKYFADWAISQPLHYKHLIHSIHF